MLGLEDFMTIQALVKRVSTSVCRAVKRGGAPAARRGRRGSRLDPYRAVIIGPRGCGTR
jgi:hypothetical protein